MTQRPIPLLDLKAQLATYRDEAMAAIARVVDSQRLILGDEVRDFEASLAAYLGLPHAVGVSSGTDALLIALMALDIGPGDQVVTTPFSFFATAGVVARLNATPVFVDIDPATFNLPEAGVRAAVNSATRAVIPVHLFGQACDLGTFYDEPDRPAVIEDAAQAIGARLRGRGVGDFGDFATLSFYPTKNLGAFGDAGATLCRDPELAEKLRILRVHGSKPKYYHHVVGGNFRLDALQAAVLAVKLRHLDTWAERRRANAGRYDLQLAESGLVERGLVTPPPRHPEAHHIFNQYVVRATDRDALRAHLADNGVGTMVYYPGALHLQPCFEDLGHGPGDFPEAERACREVLALPVYPELDPDAVQRVVATISSFYSL